MPSQSAGTTVYPLWMRWVSAAWFALWFPAYWRTWGLANFAHFCDVAVILTCIGMWTNSAALISSQAVGALVVDLVWALDAGWFLILRRPLFGGNEFLLDSRYPAWVRLLTLFHVVMPVLLIWGLYRAGYDRRGYKLQCAIALPVFIAARFTSPARNIDYAFADPFFRRAWGPAPAHIAVIWLFMVFVVYLPTHFALKKLFPAPQEKTC
ncbi:MAG TPA: hypothetical protein VMM16_00940 [Verrucomicrobiae bacterium]|nr:hypothetical protein [Verrucomicrobiae bacterium]